MTECKPYMPILGSSGLNGGSPDVIPRGALARNGVRLHVSEKPLIDDGVHFLQVDEQCLGSPANVCRSMLSEFEGALIISSAHLNTLRM